MYDAPTYYASMAGDCPPSVACLMSAPAHPLVQLRCGQSGVRLQLCSEIRGRHLGARVDGRLTRRTG